MMGACSISLRNYEFQPRNDYFPGGVARAVSIRIEFSC